MSLWMVTWGFCWGCWEKFMFPVTLAFKGKILIMKLATFWARAWSGSSSQMQSVPLCQLKMSDGLPARWTPPCQGPFTSWGCPLIYMMTNDYPEKSQAGRHGIPMYVCVYVWERAFTCWAGGPSLQGFRVREPPCSDCSPVAQQKKKRRRRIDVWGDRGDWERTEREVRHGTSGDTLSKPHTLWWDLLRSHWHPIWPRGPWHQSTSIFTHLGVCTSSRHRFAVKLCSKIIHHAWS